MAKIVWTIAGFDPSSGAGITADLMTFAAHGLFGCSAVTALTVQSTMGVAATELVEASTLRYTLAHLQADLPPVGVKVGMLASAENAEAVGEFLHAVRRLEHGPVVVLDPVLRSTSGAELYPISALEVLHAAVLPQVDWVTPNWDELGLLSDSAVTDAGSAEAAMRGLQARHPGLNVIVTGGDQARPTELVRTAAGQSWNVQGERVQTSSTHGTGCAFSSALLSELVLGAEAETAVRRAKAFVEGALRNAPGVGHGKGPMGLLWPLRAEAPGDEDGHEGTA